MKVLPVLMVLSFGWAAAQMTHTVETGDTLSSIARRYQTTPTALQDLNTLPGSHIQVGQTLRLPAPPQHTVQAGETLYSIARTAGLTPEALFTLNGLQSSTLQIGQTLRLTGSVPVAGTPLAVTTAAPPPAPFTARGAGQLERGLFTPTRLPTFVPVTIRTAGTHRTRPASAYLPKVGFERQTLNNCGPASVAAALKAYGIFADQRTWQERLRPAGGNMQTAAAAELLNELAFEASVRRNGTLEDVKRHVAEGHPVIVLQYHSVLGKTPHFRVVRGYDDTQGILIMSDSLSGPNVALTERDFDLLWNTQGRQYLPVEPPRG